MEVNTSQSGTNEQYKSIKLSFTNIIDNYMQFLFSITDSTLLNSNNADILKRKFYKVGQELFEFVKQHKELVLINEYVATMNNEVVCKLIFENSDAADKFFDYEKFITFYKTYKEIGKKKPSLKFSTDATFKPSGLILFLERIFEKRIGEITTEDLSNYENIAFIKIKTWKETKRSCAELNKMLARRRCDFDNKQISAGRTDELSFTYNEATQHIAEGKNCTICGEEGFEFDQQLCRLPCGDVFHKSCIDKWFKPPGTRIDDIPHDSEDDISHDSEDDITIAELEASELLLSGVGQISR